MAIGGRQDRPGRAFPRGLLGALILIAGVEVGVEWNAIDFQGGSHWSCRIASREATTRADQDQFLCLGDSLIKLGLSPAVIEAETGLRGYNLAQTGGQAPGSYFLLRHALDAGAHPRAIVVDFFPSMLRLDTSYNDENWPFLADLGEAWELAALNHRSNDLTWHAIRLAFPSARSRTSLRTWFYFLANPNPKISIRDEVLKSIRNWQVNRGAEITKTQTETAADLLGWEQGYFGTFQCLPIHRFYIRKFLDLAAEHQIPVFWILPPYQPDLQARINASGFDRAHTAFVRSYQDLYSNLTVLDARQSRYPATVFHDYHHLGAAGAVALSADVGQILQQRIGASNSPNRWVKLPDYQARLATDLVETTDDSRVIVRREVRNGRLGGLLR